MFFARIPSTISALKTMGRTILTGSAFALTTTALSCGLAIAIEGTAHRTLYYLQPGWYEGVTYAYGLPQLEHARHDAHFASEASGAVATSREHEQEQSLAEEQQNEEFFVENKAQLAWNNTDETVFTTSKIEEQKRRDEEKKNEQDKFILPTADRLLNHVFSTALTT